MKIHVEFEMYFSSFIKKLYINLKIFIVLQMILQNF